MSRNTFRRTVTEIKSLVEGDMTTGYVLREAINRIKESQPTYDWVGIYLLDGDHLELFDYIGKPTEHTRIPVGIGVCGTAVGTGENQLIDDVTAHDNYLACSVETRSEIVVLIRRGEDIFGQIDIDSDRVGNFSAEDEVFLSRIADLLAARFPWTPAG